MTCITLPVFIELLLYFLLPIGMVIVEVEAFSDRQNDRLLISGFVIMGVGFVACVFGCIRYHRRRTYLSLNTTTEDTIL